MIEDTAVIGPRIVAAALTLCTVLFVAADTSAAGGPDGRSLSPRSLTSHGRAKVHAAHLGDRPQTPPPAQLIDRDLQTVYTWTGGNLALVLDLGRPCVVESIRLFNAPGHKPAGMPILLADVAIAPASFDP